MRPMTFLAALILTATTAIMAAADIHIYDRQADGTARKVGRVTSGGGDWAVDCAGGVCIGVACSACHTQPVDQNRFSNDRELRHEKIHFPKHALALSEGQKTAFGKFVVSRSKGVLIMQDQQGRRYQLPPDTLLVNDRNRAPLFIFYRGLNPAPPMK